MKGLWDYWLALFLVVIPSFLGALPQARHPVAMLSSSFVGSILSCSMTRRPSKAPSGYAEFLLCRQYIKLLHDKKAKQGRMESVTKF